MKPKNLRRELQRRRIRPTKAAFRVMKRHPTTWEERLILHTLPNGTTLAFTPRELALLRRQELNRRLLVAHAQRRNALIRERAGAAVFTLFLGLPATAIILVTLVAIYYNLL